MRKFSSRAVVVAFIMAIGVSVSGCGQVAALRAKMAFREANQLYASQDYREAAAKYEEVVADPAAIDADPRLASAYFFLGNSYDNMYRPTKRGEAENDQLLQKAIQYYRLGAERDQDPKIKRLSMEYLVSAYGPEKLNDPSQAEPIMLKMIQDDPADTTAYFGLANIYEQNGDYERAEDMLIKARDAKPNVPEVYMQLAGFYNRQGDFAKTMEALHTRADREPTNPEAYYTIATYYWEKAYRDFTTPQADKVKFVQDGLKAVDKAIELKPDYFEALTYKNLLLRVQANLEKDPGKQQALLREADAFRSRAEEIRKKQQAAGAGD